MTLFHGPRKLVRHLKKKKSKIIYFCFIIAIRNYDKELIRCNQTSVLEPSFKAIIPNWNEKETLEHNSRTVEARTPMINELPVEFDIIPAVSGKTVNIKLPELLNALNHLESSEVLSIELKTANPNLSLQGYTTGNSYVHGRMFSNIGSIINTTYENFQGVENEKLFINIANTGPDDISDVQVNIKFLGISGNTDLRFCNFGIDDLTMSFSLSGQGSFSLKKYSNSSRRFCECKLLTNVPLGQDINISVSGSYIYDIPILPYNATMKPYEYQNNFGVFNATPDPVTGQQRFMIFPGSSPSNSCDLIINI